MPPVVIDPKKLRPFATEAAFEAWLAQHHDRETELWIKFHKKGSGLPTIVYKQALDVALCWGWIDGLSKSLDDTSYAQRFTPRKAKSIWSPRVEKTLCDEAGIFDKQVAYELFARAIAVGLVSEKDKVPGFPAQLWVVDDAGRVFELIYGGSRTGRYHGYPIRRANPLFDKISVAWAARRHG